MRVRTFRQNRAARTGVIDTLAENRQWLQMQTNGLCRDVSMHVHKLQKKQCLQMPKWSKLMANVA